MGADTFTTTAKGRTAREAFGAAREDACHWHGHGGYTGTVAEKSDFVMIADTGKELKARLDRAIKGVRDLQRRLRKPGKQRITFELTALERRLDLRLGVDPLVLDEGTKAEALSELREALDRLRAATRRCRARMKPGEIADLLIEIGDSRVDDKWGPAGCIDLTPRKKHDKEFLFFGVASC